MNAETVLTAIDPWIRFDHVGMDNLPKRITYLRLSQILGWTDWRGACNYPEVARLASSLQQVLDNQDELE